MLVRANIHNTCLSGDSSVLTKHGEVPISQLAPGDFVLGDEAGQPAWTRVLAVYRKSTVLPSLPGRRVREGLAVTDNHVLLAAGLPAGQLPLPAVAIEGPVFDLDTGTGNYTAHGVLLEAANGKAGTSP